MHFPDIYFPVYPTQRTFTPTIHEHLPHLLIRMVVLTCNNSVTMWTARGPSIKGEAQRTLKRVTVSQLHCESLSSTTLQDDALFIFRIHATTLYFQKKRIKLQGKFVRFDPQTTENGVHISCLTLVPDLCCLHRCCENVLCLWILCRQFTQAVP